MGTRVKRTTDEHAAHTSCIVHNGARCKGQANGRPQQPRYFKTNSKRTPRHRIFVISRPSFAIGSSISTSMHGRFQASRSPGRPALPACMSPRGLAHMLGALKALCFMIFIVRTKYCFSIMPIFATTGVQRNVADPPRLFGVWRVTQNWCWQCGVRRRHVAVRVEGGAHYCVGSALGWARSPTLRQN